MVTAAFPTPMKPVQAPPIKEPSDTIVAKLHSWVNGFFEQLPNMAAAIAFLVIAWLVAKGVAALVRRYADKRDRLDLGVLLSSVAYGTILIVALMVAAAIVFPSVKPADILATLGVGSVAVGFAFKDILQNLFAGLLLLMNRPFKRGDQIVAKDFEGTVEHIQSRATLIKTYDGRRVIIPNADIYTSPVVVNTHFPVRRDQYDIGVGYADQPMRAAEIILDALRSAEGVVADPKPEVLPWALDESSVTLRARWWANSRDLIHTRPHVIQAIYQACVDNGIDLPFPTRTILFHDQTEETDGDRRRQREGWPAGEDPPKPARDAAEGSTPS
jgi:small conductance mechanosensitive channel